MLCGRRKSRGGLLKEPQATKNQNYCGLSELLEPTPICSVYTGIPGQKGTSLTWGLRKVQNNKILHLQTLQSTLNPEQYHPLPCLLLYTTLSVQNCQQETGGQGVEKSTKGTSPIGKEKSNVKYLWVGIPCRVLNGASLWIFFLLTFRGGPSCTLRRCTAPAATHH